MQNHGDNSADHIGKSSKTCKRKFSESWFRDSEILSQVTKMKISRICWIKHKDSVFYSVDDFFNSNLFYNFFRQILLQIVFLLFTYLIE